MHSTTQQAWDCALGILQPTPDQLEHGLELHRRSLVIDSYAFAPSAKVEAAPLEEAAKAGASFYELTELYQELRTNGMVHDATQREGYKAAFAQAGVDCIMQNAGEENNDVEILLHRLSRFTYVTDNMPEFLRRGVTPEDIVAAHREGKKVLCLTTNGVPLPRSFRSVAEGTAFIRVFARLGVRMMHLTYNRRNLMGDGCGEPHDGGLSQFGRSVIEEMNRVGIMVDISHSGNKTGLDAALASSVPVVISHAACGALSDHCRAKPDELLRAVAERGGTIGICCMPGFLQRSWDIAAFLDHVDHAVKVAGIEHVTIGTDTAMACTPDQPEPAISFPPVRPLFESLWPTSRPMDSLTTKTPPLPPQHLGSLAWSNWPLFTVGLVQRGYSDADIQKIIGGNILRVAREVYGAARPFGA